MRILVLSDSHGDSAVVKKIIKSQPDASVVVFCGDGEVDIDSAIEAFPEKEFHCVRGNCDYSSKKDIVNVFMAEHKKVMYTHGHTYNVKSSLVDLLFAARAAKVNILLYGHTHEAYNRYIDGIFVINPGSCSGYKASFAVIDIEKNGILPALISVDSI